jgi:hypothetical protein
MNPDSKTSPLQWLQKHKYESHLMAFLLMAIPPVPLYLAAQHGATGWIWFLISLVILGNLVVLIVR